MCGIAGYVSSISEAHDITDMVSALARRGPDGEGTAAWPGVSFGHRRLAIIDVSDAGRQPMLSDDGRVVKLTEKLVAVELNEPFSAAALVLTQIE